MLRRKLQIINKENNEHLCVIGNEKSHDYTRIKSANFVDILSTSIYYCMCNYSNTIGFIVHLIFNCPRI